MSPNQHSIKAHNDYMCNETENLLSDGVPG